MSSVDKRIVEMQFNNKQFESGAKETIKTLEELDKNLQFDKTGIAKGLDAIADKFSVLGTAARRAVENVTDSIMGVGKNLMNDFFVAPKTDGFGEYELKMGSIQTILGSVIDDYGSEEEALAAINEQLDALNKYADKTKYSFAEATPSINKFTNAGVKLDSAVGAIQGIMNLAGVSGQGAAQANSAMYNFAQALGTGYLGLMDWKSIENANMATVEFKNELIDTAVAMGTLTKNGDKFISTTTNGMGKISDEFDAMSGFRDSLQHQWITADVLTTTLERYADETTDIGKKASEATTKIFKFTEMMGALKETTGSGWARTWELIFGDYNEAAILWTGVYHHFNSILEKQGESRNKLLETWRTEYDGANQLKNVLNAIYNTIMQIVRPIQEAFREVFPPATAETLYNILDGFRKFMIDIRLSQEASNVLKSIFIGVFTAFKNALSILKPIGAVVKGIFSLLKPVANIIGLIFEEVKDTITGIVDVFSDGGKVDIIQSITNGITSAFEWMAEHLQNAYDIIKKSFSSTEARINPAIEVARKIKDFFTGIKDGVSSGFKDLNGLKAVQDQIIGVFAGLGSAIGNGFQGVIDWFKSLMIQMKNYNFGSMLDALNLGAIVVAIVQVHKAIKSLKDISENIERLTDGLADILKNVSGVLKNVSGVLKAYAMDLKSNAFIKIALAVAILVAAMIALTFVDQDKLASAAGVLVMLAGALTVLIAATGKVQTIDKAFNTLANSFSLMAVGGGLILIAVGLAAILGVILLYNKISWATIVKGIVSLFGVLVAVGGTMVIFAAIASECKAALLAFGAAFITIAAGMAILAGAISIFTAISWETLGKAGATFVVFVGLLVGAILLLQKIPNRKISQISNGFVKLAAAFAILTASLGLLVPTLIAFTMIANLGGWKGFALMAATIGVLSAGLLALAAAVKIMGENAKYLGNIAMGLGLLTLSILAIAIIAPIILANADQIRDAFITLVQIVCSVIKNSAKPIISALFALLTETISALKENLPTLIDDILSMLVSVLTAIGDYTPKIVSELYRIVKGIVEGLKDLLSDGMPDAKIIANIAIGMMGLVVVIRMMAKAKADIKNAAGTLVFMLILMAGVAAVFKIMNDAGMSADNTIDQAISIGLVLGALALSIKSINGVRGGIKAAPAVLANMAIMVASIYAIMGVFQLMTNLDGSKMVKQAVAIGLLMLAIGQVSKHATEVGGIKQATGMAIAMGAFVVVLWTLVGAFKILSDLEDPNKMIAQAVAISLLLLAIGLSVKMTSRMRGGIQKGTAVAIEIGAFMVAMLATILVFKELQGVDGAAMIPQAIAIGLLLAAIGLAVKITSGMNSNIQKGTGVAIEIGGFIAAMVAAMFVFKELQGIDGVAMIPQAVALGILLNLMATAVAITSGIKTNVKDASAVALQMAEFMGVLYLSTGIFHLLGSLDGVNMIPQAVALGTLLDLLAVACLITSGIKLEGAIEGATALDSWILIVGGLFTGLAGIFGSIQELTGGSFGDVMESGLDFLVTVFTGIGEAIGGFVGGLLGGIAEGIMSVLPDIGTMLTEFMFNIQGFLVGCRLIDDQVVNGAMGLAGVITAFLAIGVLNALSGFIGMISGGISLVSIGVMLEEFAPHMKSFLDIIADVGPDVANAAANVGNAIANLFNALPREGGLQSVVNGRLDLVSLFSPDEEGLNIFGHIGRGLMQFQNETKGLDEQTVTNAVRCGEIISAFAKSLPKTGGITQMWEGEVGYTQFGNGMAAVGKGIRRFKEEAGDITKQDVETGVAAGKMLIGLAEGIPKEGGIWQAIVGRTGYDDFSSGMTHVGQAIRNFKEEAGSITEADVQSGINSGNLLVGFAQSLEGGGSSWNSFWNDLFGSGSFNYEQFKTDITMMGEAISSFAKSTQGVNQVAVEKAKFAGESLVNFTAALDKRDDNGNWLTNLFSSGFNYQDFKDNIILMGKALSQFSSDTSTIDGDAVDKAVQALNGLIEVTKNAKDVDIKSFNNFNKAMDNLAKEGINAFINNFNNSDEIINNGVSKYMGKVESAVTTYKSGPVTAMWTTAGELTSIIGETDTYTAGDNLMYKLRDGMMNQIEPIRNTMGTVIDTIISKIKSDEIRDKFKTNGKWLIERIKDGIDNSKTLLTNKAREIMELISSTFHSFNPKWSEAGENICKGLTSGMQVSKRLVNAKAVEIAHDTLEAMKKTLDMHSPSKKAMKIGEFTDEGFAFGLKNNAYKITSAAEYAGNTALQMLYEVFDNIDNVDMTPTIMPVMDLQNIQNGVNSMNNIIGQSTETVSMLNSTFDRAKAINIDMNESADRNREVVAKLEELRGDVEVLSSVMSNRKIVMDTGALVGALTPGMDKSLGTRMKRVKRGI